MAKLPSVTSQIPRDLRAFLDRVREGFQGLVTREQLESGEVVPARARASEDGGAFFQRDPNTGCEISPVPPAPTGLEATGTYRNILLQWDKPTYCGHAHTEVWRAETDDFSVAERIAIATGWFHIDEVGNQAGFYYWIFNVNINEIRGPVNQLAGTYGESAIDVEYMLETLTGAITEGQLYQDLGDRIDLIDGAASLVGSVNARLLTEAQARGAAITAVENAYQAADSSLASQISTVSAAVGTNASAIQTEQTARANGDSALASQITTLASTVGGNTAAIQTEAQTRASETGDLFAQYTVKIDLNGYVAGYGLASTSVNGTPTSEFLVRADRFAVGSPGKNDIIPFIVQASQTTINGETVPAGVYIDSAYIKNGTITTAKIGNAAIDNAKILNISAAKITTGSLDADRIAAGSITADKIDAKGLTIKDNAGNVLLNAIAGEISPTVYVGSGSDRKLMSVLANNALVASVNFVGSFSSAPSPNATRNISALNRTNDLVTLTTSVNHGFHAGNLVTVAGLSGWNGTFEIITIPANNKIQYIQDAANASRGSGGTATSGLYKQNSVYLNTTDKNSYILTGSPLAWVSYLERGQTGATGPQGNTGATGPQGPAGAAGQRGSQTFYVATNNAAWSSALANYTVGTKVLNDVVTQYKEGVWGETRFWNGSSWVTVTQAIDGNLLVNGTVGATKISANAITADKISSSNGLFTADSDGKITAVSATIGDLSVTTAMIADAAVDTLKIAGESIIVPRFGQQFVDTGISTSWAGPYATTYYTVSGLEPGENIRVVAIASVQAYPGNGTVTNLQCGIFSGPYLISNVASTYSGSGISITTIGSWLIGNGTNSASVRLRAETNPGGASSKSDNNFVVKLLIMAAKR